MWAQSSFRGELGSKHDMTDNHAIHISGRVPGSPDLKLRGAESFADRDLTLELDQNSLDKVSDLLFSDHGAGPSSAGEVQQTRSGPASPASAGSMTTARGSPGSPASTTPGGRRTAAGYLARRFGHVEVHGMHCGVYGRQAIMSGMRVPSWARSVKGTSIYRDYVVGYGYPRTQCTCAELVTAYDVWNNRIALTQEAVEASFVSSMFYFVHIAKPEDDLGEASCFLYIKDNQWRLRLDDRLLSWMRAFVSTPDHQQWCLPLRSVPCESLSVCNVADLPVVPFPITGEVLAPGLPVVLSESMKKVVHYAEMHRPAGDENTPGTAAALASDIVHIGDHSITGTGTYDTPNLGPMTGCNIFTWLQERLSDTSRIVRWDMDDTELRFSSRLTSGPQNFRGRVADVEDGFSYWSSVAVPIIIGTRNTKNIGQLDFLQATNCFQDGGTLVAKNVEALLVGCKLFTLELARAMSTKFAEATIRYDNTSLYAKGWHLIFLKQAIDQYQRYHPRWRPTNEAFYQRINISTAQGITALGNAISQQRFVVDLTSRTAGFINCLRHLSRHLIPMDWQVGVINPVAATTQWFGVNFSVVLAGDIAEDYTCADFTPDDMFQCLSDLARERGEDQYFAAGFIRATAHFHTVAKGREDDPYRFYATTESVATVNWTTPRSHNFLWDLLSYKRLTTETPVIVPPEEIKILRGMRLGLAIERSAFLAGMLSVGVGIGLNRCNVTGDVITRCSSRAATLGVYEIIRRDLFFPEPTTSKPLPISVIFLAMLWETNTAFGAMIPAELFWNSTYSGGFAQFGAHDQLAWQTAFRFRVPYVVRALSMAAHIQGWPLCWGMFFGEVRANIVGEITRVGLNPGWYMANGCQSYKTRESSEGCRMPMANSYIPYGLALLQNIGQATEPPTRFNFMFQSFATDLNLGNVNGELLAADEYTDDDYIAELGVYHPGTIRTFDFSTGAELAPFVKEDDIPPVIFASLERNLYNGATGIFNAGVLGSRFTPQVIIRHWAVGVGGILGSADLHVDRIPSAPVADQEGVGNAQGPAPAAPQAQG